MSLTRFSPSHFDVRNIEGSAWSGSFHLGRRYRVFIGVLLLSIAVSTAAVAAPVITAISTETQADTERVLVHATEPLQYTAFKLQEPLRLVVDFSSASLGDLPQPIPIRGEIVEKIEPILFPDEGIVPYRASFESSEFYTKAIAELEQLVAVEKDTKCKKERLLEELEHLDKVVSRKIEDLRHQINDL